MARSPQQFLAEMLALTPPGSALPREPTSNWAAFLAAPAAIFAEVQAAAESMLPQVDPRAATAFLGDFQRVLGADPYGRDAPSQNLSAQGEAQLLWERWTEAPGCSIADYVALAASAGQQITIQEFSASLTGVAVCGDPCATEGAEFYWEATLPVTNVEVAQTGAAVCGDPLGSYTPNLLGNLLAALAPAHTVPVFSYVGV